MNPPNENRNIFLLNITKQKRASLYVYAISYSQINIFMYPIHFEKRLIKMSGYNFVEELFFIKKFDYFYNPYVTKTPVDQRRMELSPPFFNSNFM